MRKGVVITPADFVGADWLEKMRRFKLNTLGIHSGGGAAHDVLAVLGEYAREEFRERCRAAGIDVEYELHSPCELLPRELFAEHPEYFPFDARSDRRVAGGNWCVGSAEALRRVGVNAAQLGKMLAPATHRYFFWGEDSAHGGWCHCDACLGLTPSEQNLAGANAMAAALRRQDPAARVGLLSYLSTLETPRRVTPGEGVFLEFAPIDRCYRHAVDDENCAINRRIWRGLLEQLEVFDAQEAHILEYWLDSSYFSRYVKPAKAPVVTPEVIRRDIAAYRGLGISSIATFAVYMDGEYFDRFGEKLLEAYSGAF